MHKIAIIYSIPSPYREGFFEELHQFSNNDYTLLYCGRKKFGRNWLFKLGNYNYKILSGYELFNGKFVNLEIVSDIFKKKYDKVVIAGYSYPTAIAAFILAKIKRKPIILWSASAFGLKNKKKPVRTILKKCIVRFSNGFIVPGEQAKNQILYLGGRKDDIKIVPFNSLSHSWFEHKNSKNPYNKEQFNILFVGRLIREKGVHKLIYAVKLIKNKDVVLNLVGDGSYKHELMKICENEKMKNVVFHGNVKYSDLNNYYCNADLMVLPTYKDEWPLVLLEAMASKCLVITTKNVGSLEDLLYDYKYIVGDFKDVSELKHMIITIYNLPQKEKERIREELYKRTLFYTQKNAAIIFDEAIKSISLTKCKKLIR